MLKHENQSGGPCVKDSPCGVIGAVLNLIENRNIPTIEICVTELAPFNCYRERAHINELWDGHASGQCAQGWIYASLECEHSR